MTDIQDNNDTNENAPETTPTFEVTATPEEAVAPAPETSAAEAETPKDEKTKGAKTKSAKTKGEKPKKRLVAGLSAAAQSKGASLKEVGVATIRMGSDMEQVQTEVIDAEGNPLDPAADMPMYRPGMDWFVLRVASNKEGTVRETLLRKVQIEGMENMVGRIMVPTEKTKTLKGGAQRITETKLYPGYVFVEMRLEPDGRIPQDVFFLIKETTGVGDFVGTAGRPTPMAPAEVEKMLFDSRQPDEAPQVKMEFEPGDNVTIKEGPFENFEGTVDEVLPEKGLVRVLVTIFGRQAPVELEYWQIAKAEE